MVFIWFGMMENKGDPSHLELSRTALRLRLTVVITSQPRADVPFRADRRRNDVTARRYANLLVVGQVEVIEFSAYLLAALFVCSIRRIHVLHGWAAPPAEKCFSP